MASERNSLSKTKIANLICSFCLDGRLYQSVRIVPLKTSMSSIGSIEAISKEALHNSVELANSKFPPPLFFTTLLKRKPFPSSIFFLTLSFGS